MLLKFNNYQNTKNVMLCHKSIRKSTKIIIEKSKFESATATVVNLRITKY